MKKMEFGYDQQQSDLGFSNQDQDNLDNLTISVPEEPSSKSVGSSQLISKCTYNSTCSQIFSGPNAKSALKCHIFQEHFDTSRISADFGTFAETFKRKRIELGYSQTGVIQGIRRLFGSNCSRTTLANFEHLRLPYKSMAKFETTLRRWLNDVENENVSTRNIETRPKCETRKKMRNRTMFNPQQRSILEKSFLQARRLSRGELALLAQNLGLGKKVVMTWFSNRRYEESHKPRTTPGVKNKPRTFTPEFKQMVFEAFNSSPECIGNYSATAKKFGIDRRQVQNWTLKLANSGILENAFLQTEKLSRGELSLLAQNLGLDKKVVRNWFANRRSQRAWTVINKLNKPRRTFTSEFKQMVFEAFNSRPECIGDYLATAKIFGIDRRQVQKWTGKLANGNPLISQISSESDDQNSSRQTCPEISEIPEIPETMVFPSTSKIQTCDFATQEPAFINVDENFLKIISTFSLSTSTTTTNQKENLENLENSASFESQI